jgi:hypothetical protein
VGSTKRCNNKAGILELWNKSGTLFLGVRLHLTHPSIIHPSSIHHDIKQATKSLNLDGVDVRHSKIAWPHTQHTHTPNPSAPARCIWPARPIMQRWGLLWPDLGTVCKKADLRTCKLQFLRKDGVAPCLRCSSGSKETSDLATCTHHITP